jgi:PhoPQ-activated pathogenicity-related protein
MPFESAIIFDKHDVYSGTNGGRFKKTRSRSRLRGKLSIERLEDRTLLSSGTTSAVVPLAPGTLTGLDNYVSAPDSSYKYSLNSTLTGPGFTDYVIDLTSQTWRSPSEVDKTLWKHWLQIIVPTVVTRTTAVLEITGGSNLSSAPTTPDGFGLSTATTLGAVAVVLPDVPSEPLTFAGETSARTEDQIIAYTFNQFLNGGDQNWPLLLPMVKSAVRAMDTAQSFVASQFSGTIQIKDFIVTGASKRGWTTWLTPAVDSRVRAIVPFVFDVLNSSLQLPHHKDTYVGVTQDIVGGYSYAIQDYTNFHVFDRLNTPQGQALLHIVDPYQYLGRPSYNIPKYLVDSSGDQFFVPDSAQFYFHNLPGQNYIRYVPNTGHGLNGDAGTGAINFEQVLLDGASLPNFSWNVADSGTTINLMTVDTPTSVTMWQAVNPNSRDFRIETFGPNWTSSPLTDQGGGLYVAHVTAPATRGAIGFFIQMVYTVDGVPLTFTTQISTVPLFVPKVVAIDPSGPYTAEGFAATANVTGVAGGTVAGSLAYTYYVGNTVSGPGSPDAPTNVGTYTVVASFTSANPSYVGGSSAPLTFSISRAKPTVVAIDPTGPYTGSPFPASGTATGTDGGSVNGTFSFTYCDGPTASGKGSSVAPTHAGTFTVVASFTSADPNYTDAQSAPLTFSITSNDLPLTASASTITARPGLAFTGRVAKFTDADTHAGAADFTATIDWGDGNTSTGIISADKAGGFDVSGGHTYTLNGSYTVVVTIIDQAGGVGEQATAQTTSLVATVPLTAIGQVLSATEGISTGPKIPVVVSAANPNAVASDFTGTINWGDNSTSSASFVDNGNGTFQVVGTHTFAEEGTYSVSAQVTDLDGNQVSATGSVTVTDAQLVMTPVEVALSARGTAINVLVATFRDQGGVDPATVYTAQISWGDASLNTPGIVTVANGIYRVTGSHIYTVLGNFPVTVTVSEDGGSSAQIGTTTVNRSLNERFVTLLYLDLLQRIVDDNTLVTVGNLLDLGTQTRAQVAQTVVNSSEYHTDVVQSLFQQVLRRGADPSGLSAGVQFLANGGTAQQLQALLYGSDEYFNLQGGTVDGFLTALYQDVLHRAIDSASKQNLTTAIAQGLSRTAVATAVLGSQESDALQVKALFLQFLHRPVDSANLTAFVGQLQKGTTIEQLIVMLTGSPEYALQSGGDANQVFIIQLFRDLLLRDVDAPSLNFFTAQLDSGALSRQRVVTLLINSPEYHALEVQQAFQSFLHRVADPASVAGFSNFLAQGGTVEQLDAILASSSEYFNNRVGGTNDGFVNAIFFDVLGRPVDSGTRMLYDQALANGVSTKQIATALLASPEYAQKLVDRLYQHFLPPPADNSGRAALINAFLSGLRDEGLIAILVESGEYFKRL